MMPPVTVILCWWELLRLCCAPERRMGKRRRPRRGDSNRLEAGEVRDECGERRKGKEDGMNASEMEMAEMTRSRRGETAAMVIL